MTLLCHIMTLLYHLYFCKCPDNYFSLFHYLQQDYSSYFTYYTSIISLFFSSYINVISESIKNELLTTTDLPGILLKLKKEGSKLGFWVSIDYAIKYNSDEYIKHLDKFIFYTEAQQIIRIPLPEDERSEESLNSFMKKRITNIKITVDDSVIKNKFIESINFVSRY